MDIEDEYEENQDVLDQLSSMIGDLSCEDLIIDLKEVIENCKNRLEELLPIMQEQNKKEKQYFNAIYERSAL